MAGCVVFYESQSRLVEMNIMDEAISEYLKKKYGNSIEKKKVVIEVILQLKGDNYEIVSARCPKENVEFRIK
jgi:hypothetical protein